MASSILSISKGWVHDRKAMGEALQLITNAFERAALSHDTRELEDGMRTMRFLAMHVVNAVQDYTREAAMITSRQAAAACQPKEQLEKAA